MYCPSAAPVWLHFLDGADVSKGPLPPDGPVLSALAGVSPSHPGSSAPLSMSSNQMFFQDPILHRVGVLSPLTSRTVSLHGRPGLRSSCWICPLFTLKTCVSTQLESRSNNHFALAGKNKSSNKLARPVCFDVKILPLVTVGRCDGFCGSKMHQSGRRHTPLHP